MQSFWGSASLAAAFGSSLWLALVIAGNGPEAWLGMQIGAFIGLISLVFELKLLDRSLSQMANVGLQATLTTFFLRLVTVAPFTVYFGKPGSPTDAQAFALAYLSTYFVYMCWLTWRIYNAPVCYQGARDKQPATKTPTRTRGPEIARHL